jgi:glycosyltransferase domain-containing protein
MDRPADRLTVVIPTRGRRDPLTRTLDYLARTAFPFRVIIADDGPEPDRDVTAYQIDKLTEAGLRVSHQRHTPTPLVAKVARSLETVGTPYAALGADDDVHVPLGLDEAVRFLDTHPDYALAHGRAALIHIARDAPGNRVRALEAYRQRALESAAPTRRLQSHFSQFSSTWHSTHRTGELRANLAEATRLNLDLSFSELLASGLSLIQGKMHKGKFLYMVRESHATGAGAGVPSVFDWISSSHWAGQYRLVRNCWSNALAMSESMPPGRHGTTIDELFRAFLAARLRHHANSDTEPLENLSLEAVCKPESPDYNAFAPVLAAREA